MKNKVFYLLGIIFVSLMVFLAGCGDKAVESELKEICKQNLKACQDENMELALVDIEESLRGNTRVVMNKLFKDYDLEYKLIDFKLLSVEGDIAKVEVVQDTKKIAGPEFQNNRITVIHTFKKIEGKWKFIETKLKSFDII